MTHWHIKTAARVLNRGGIITYPTESVFGLGCDPENIAAVMALLHLKKRDLNKGLVIVANDLSQLEPYIDLSNARYCDTLTKETTKPITWLLPCYDHTPLWLTGEFNTLAVRISQHPIVRQLCTEFNAAIVSTSANLSGRKSLKKIWQVRKNFANKVDYYVPGGLGGFANESEIRDIVSNDIIRHS